MSRKDCIAKFLGKINHEELFEHSAEYQKRGQSEQEAMLSAVRDKVQELKIEHTKVMQEVRDAWVKDGGKKFQPKLVDKDMPDELQNAKLVDNDKATVDEADKGAQTQTEAFKKWLGDSKVVDADGNPLVVYHGTNKTEQGDAFTMFDAYGSNYGLFGQGAYFTENPEVASSYTSKGRGDAPTVYPAYLSIKNPIDMDARADRAAWEDGFKDVDFDTYEPSGTSNEAFYRAVEEHLTDEHVPKWEGAEMMQSGLRAMGYDGITHVGGGRVKSEGVRHQVYIAFDPEQIKSSTGNNGNFDPVNPDIRMARGLGPEAFGRKIAQKPSGMPVDDVQKTVDAMADKWQDGPNIKVVATHADLPTDAPSDARGLIHQGTAYVVASNHQTPDAVARTLAHEAIGHYGLWKVLGVDGRRQFEKNLQLALKSGNKPLNDIAARVRELYVDSDGKFNLSPAEEANEIAAFAVEDAIDANGHFKPGYGFIKQVWSKVADFLRSRGVDVKFTNAELQGMLVSSMRGLEVGHRLDGGLNGLVAAARDRMSDAGLKAFGKLDDLYRFPKSKSKDLEQIARDNGEEVKLRTTNLGSEKLHTITFENGTVIRIYDRPADPYGQDKQVYGMEIDDYDYPKDQQVGRPGENPEAVPPTDDVWLDVSQNSPGKYGAIAYNIAATYAHNNGKIFIGDPSGLSDMALRRRTEQMLSSALKFGTTEHLAPHPRQVSGDTKLGVPPLKWVYGDHTGNVERMVDVNLKSLENASSGATNDLTFDPTTGEFRSKSGDVVPLRPSTMGSEPADYGRGIREARAGWRTNARSAFLRSFLGPNGKAEGSGLLDRAITGISGIHDRGMGEGPRPSEERIFYARGNADGVDSKREEDYTHPGANFLTRAKDFTSDLFSGLTDNNAVREATMAVAPMSTGSKEARAAAQKFANAERLARYQWNKMDDMLTSKFTKTQRESMWNAADEQNVLLQQAKEPPVPDGYVRVYHGGSDMAEADSRWVMPKDKRYAEGYAAKSADGKVFYADIPENDPRLKKAFDDSGTSVKAPYTAFNLTGDEAANMKQLGVVPKGKGLDRLPADQRQVMEQLHTYSKELWQRAQDVGMVKGEGLPFWTPRMAVMIGEDGEYQRPGGEGKKSTTKGEGGNVTTSASSTKQRKYLTAEETAAAMKGKLGDEADLVRDIRTMPLAMSRLEKAIAGRELINQIKEIGLATGNETTSNTGGPGFFTLDHPAFTSYEYKQVPVRLTEYFDKKLMSGLTQLADDIGVTHERKGALKGGALGLAYRDKPLVQTKYFTPEQVLTHEIGHQLDYKYGLAEQLTRRGESAKELRNLADLRFEGDESEVSNHYRQYVRKASEKIANLVHAYVHNPERFREVAPETFKWFDGFVDKTPALQVLKDLGPSLTISSRAVDGKVSVGESKPLFLSKDFEGPLKAVMSKTDGAVYSGYMLLKSKAMSTIMASPLTHNMVIWGRALAYNPLSVGTGYMYWKGHALAKDHALMTHAILDGLVPIGANKSSMMDITDVARGIGKQGSWGDPNESWVNLSLQKLGNAFKNGLGDKVKDKMDAFGDFVHHTLLWKQVGAVQVGIYADARNYFLSKGLPPEAAGPAAAHLANRYGGAVANENMSEMARKTANVLMFSRSFNAGNLGAMKDVFAGLPAGLKAKMYADVGKEMGDKTMSLAKRKARVGLVTEAAVAILLINVTQAAVNMIKQDESLDDVQKGYARRLDSMIANIGEHPMNPTSYNPYRLSPTWDNEPDKKDRIDMGADASGMHEYMRLPTGKVVEDMFGWATDFAKTFEKKMSPMAKAAKDIWSNDRGYGVPVTDPDGNTFKRIYDIAAHLAQAQVPWDTIKTVYDATQGKATELDKNKLEGFATGFSYSKGNPYGPEAAVAYESADRVMKEKKYLMEFVKRDIKYGDEDKARERLEKIGLTPREISHIIDGIENPHQGMTSQQRRNFNRHATEDEKIEMENARR